MSDLPGEGTDPILYGPIRVPARTLIHTGYMARPDLSGSFPTVLVAHSRRGINGSLKDLCRRIARNGFAVLVPDLYRGAAPGRDAGRDEAADAFRSVADRRIRNDFEDYLAFVRSSDTAWSSPDRVALLGLGDGGRAALLAAAADPTVTAVVLAYTPLWDDAVSDGRPQSADLVTGLRRPLLGLYGRADEVADPAAIAEVRATAPRSSWVLYDGVGHDFLDDDLPGFDQEAAADARGRLALFLKSVLVPAPTG